MSSYLRAVGDEFLVFQVRQLAHLTEPDTRLRERVLELEDLDL